MSYVGLASLCCSDTRDDENLSVTVTIMSVGSCGELDSLLLSLCHSALSSWEQNKRY